MRIKKLALTSLSLMLMINLAVLVIAAPQAVDATSCTANCLNGTSVTCNCIYNCTATDGVGCVCSVTGTSGTCGGPCSTCNDPPPPSCQREFCGPFIPIP